MSTNLQYDDACEASIKAVRNDSDASNWCALTYADGSMEKIVVLATGNGSADELVEKCLTEDKVVFALVRLTEVIDQSTTVKFVFVNWVGQKVKRMLKARQSIHSGSIQSFMTPHHIEIKCEDHDEISQEIVEQKVGIASGTKSHVLDNTIHSVPVTKKSQEESKPAEAKKEEKAAPAPKKEEEPKKEAEPKKEEPKKEQSLSQKTREEAMKAQRGARAPLSVAVDDEDAIRGAIADVRNNDSATNWALVTYVEGAKPCKLTLAGTGSGGVSEMVSKMDDKNVFYALTRHIEQIDNTSAVKFAHVAFTGDSTPRMLRAQKGTHKGAVEDLFRPYHIDLQTEDLPEITEETLIDRIKFASGTKSHVQ